MFGTEPLRRSRPEPDRSNRLKSTKENALRHSHLPLSPPPFKESGHGTEGLETIPSPMQGIEYHPLPSLKKQPAAKPLPPTAAAPLPSPSPVFFTLNLFDYPNYIFMPLFAAAALLFLLIYISLILFTPADLTCHVWPLLGLPSCASLSGSPTTFTNLFRVHDTLAPLQNDVTYALDLPITMSLAAADLRAAHHVWTYESRGGPALSILTSHARQLDETARSLAGFLVLVWGKMEYLDSVYVTSRTTVFSALDQGQFAAEVARLAETVCRRHVKELGKAVAEMKSRALGLERKFLDLEVETGELKVRIRRTAERLADARSGKVYPWREEGRSFLGVFTAGITEFWPGDLLGAPRAETMARREKRVEVKKKPPRREEKEPQTLLEDFIRQVRDVFPAALLQPVKAGNSTDGAKTVSETILEDFIRQVRDLFPDNLLSPPSTDAPDGAPMEPAHIVNLDRVLGAPLRASRVVQDMLRRIEEVEREVKKLSGNAWVDPMEMVKLGMWRVGGRGQGVGEGREAVVVGMRETEGEVERLRGEYPWFSTPGAVDVFL